VGVGNVVDIEHWRVQVRLGGSDSQLRTFELRREPLGQQWLLEAIDGGKLKRRMPSAPRFQLPNTLVPSQNGSFAEMLLRCPLVLEWSES
jgi:hypothetical protein